jgi:hypothetical protein
MDVDELLRTTLQRQATSVGAGSLDGPALRARARGRRDARWGLALAASSLAMTIAVGVAVPWATSLDVSPGPDVGTGPATNGKSRGPLLDNAALQMQAMAAAQRPLVQGGLGWQGSNPVVIFVGEVAGRHIAVLDRRNLRGEWELGMVAAAAPGGEELAAVAKSVGSGDHRPKQVSAILANRLVMFAQPSIDSARWVFRDPHGGKTGGRFTLAMGVWTAELTELPDGAWGGPRNPLLGIHLMVDSRVVYRGPAGPLPLGRLPK